MNPNTDPPTPPWTPVPGTPQPPHQASPTTPANQRLAGVILIGAAVTVALGVYGRLHEPTGFAVNLAGFSSGPYAKAWLATLAAGLAVVQVFSAMIMYGKLMAPAPRWIGALHRWSGRACVLATVPVAMHCLFALGFRSDSGRVLIHSLVGCLFYGAFVAKMLSLTRSNLPSKALPVVGGIVFTAVVMLWLTSSLWLFDNQGLKL